jgi:hypothetical protein
MVASAFEVDALGGVRPIDALHWLAHYADGTAVPEQAPDGRLRSFNEIDASQVVTLELVRLDGGPSIMLEVPPGATAWVGRRRDVRLNAETGQTAYDGCLTMLSWRLPDGRACWVYVRPDGLVAISDREVS